MSRYGRRRLAWWKILEGELVQEGRRRNEQDDVERVGPWLARAESGSVGTDMIVAVICRDDVVEGEIVKQMS